MSDAIHDAIAYHNGQVTKIQDQLAQLGDKAADTAETSAIDTRTQTSGANGSNRQDLLMKQLEYHRKRLTQLTVPTRHPVAARTTAVGNISDLTA